MIRTSADDSGAGTSVGTYWGNRPSIEQTLDMVREQRFDFVHPERLRPA